MIEGHSTFSGQLGPSLCEERRGEYDGEPGPPRAAKWFLALSSLINSLLASLWIRYKVIGHLWLSIAFLPLIQRQRCVRVSLCTIDVCHR